MCTNTNETCTRTILLCIKKFGRYKYINIKKRHLTQRNYKVEALGRKDARRETLVLNCALSVLKRFRKGFLKFLSQSLFLSPAVEREAGDSELCPMVTQIA